MGGRGDEIRMQKMNRTQRILTGLGVAVFLAALAVSDNEAQNNQEGGRTAEIEAAYRQIAVGYEALKPIFREGCFDCHSDKTDFPWYHSLPVIGGWMDKHVAEAREELDFSQGFPFAGRRRQPDQLLKIKREIESGAMPLRSYRLMHWGTAPNDAEKDSIFTWIDNSLRLLAKRGQFPFNKRENVPEEK